VLGGGYVDQQPLLVEVSRDSHQWIWLAVGAGGGVAKGLRAFFLMIAGERVAASHRPAGVKPTVAEM
jgi:hypothetical protein